MYVQRDLRYCSPSREIPTGVCIVGARTCSHKRLEDSSTFSCRALSSIVFNKSLLNLAVKLILRRSFGRVERFSLI